MTIVLAILIALIDIACVKWALEVLLPLVGITMRVTWLHAFWLVVLAAALRQPGLSRSDS